MKEREQEQGVSIRPNFKEWKVIAISVSAREHHPSPKEWLYILWGLDIFINGVPFLKTIVAANVLVWLIFALLWRQ